MRRMEYLGVFRHVFFYLLVGSRPPGGNSGLRTSCFHTVNLLKGLSGCLGSHGCRRSVKR